MRVNEYQTGPWLLLLSKELFPYFTAAADLDALTASWLNFRIVTPALARQLES